MDDMINAAKARLAQIEQEAETLRKFVDSADAVAAILGRSSVADLSTDSPAASPEKEFDPVVQSQRRTRVSDNPKAEVLIPAVKEILRANRKPMSRRELHKALSDRGLVVRGTDPVKTLGTILWRANDHIKQIDGWGYWPVEDYFDPAVSELLAL